MRRTVVQEVGNSDEEKGNTVVEHFHEVTLAWRPDDSFSGNR